MGFSAYFLIVWDFVRHAHEQGIPTTARGSACGALVAYGPQIRAAQETERARIINVEDRTFCARFGAGPETGRYGECAAALNEIRAWHAA